jgi:hypothetical protein
MFIGTSFPGWVNADLVQAVEIRRGFLGKPCKAQVWVKAPDPLDGRIGWAKVLERFESDFLATLSEGEAKRRLLEAIAGRELSLETPGTL